VLGVSHDVTDRKEREQSLEKILDASREMSKAKNADEIANVAVRTMEKALKMKLCSMHEYKSSENIFKPLAASDKANQILEDMVLEEKSSLAGEAFNKEESRIYEDLEQISEVYNPDSVIKSEIIIPVGDYGILISGSKQKRYFGQGEVYLAELLASITKASLERAERETKIREREKELEMKSSAMESTMDGIAIADEDGEYIYMNEAHAQMFGKSTEFFMGKSWMSLYADDEAERIKEEVFPVLEEEGQWMGETVGVKQDGTEIVQEITLTFMDDGKLICTNRDITDKKKSKRELEEKNKRLDEFNSIISHDLRNPLNVAMGYLDLYREEGEGEDLEKIENSLERIKNIIDELMAVSSNSEEMQKEKVSLERALVKAISHKDEEIDYNVFKDVEVYISSTGLVSMFENLLSNSIKHNNPPFEVEVGSTDKGFYYTDNGELEEDKEHVEEYGFTTHNDGSGIGVSIIMRIAQVNNWNVELSRTGDGSLRYDFDTSKASD
jgi:PAS domain S-box-containing protein